MENQVQIQLPVMLTVEVILALIIETQSKSYLECDTYK